MKIDLASIAMIGVVSVASPVLAKPVTQAEVERAQGQMLRRVGDAVGRFARSINIENRYVTYCSGELNRRTNNRPVDGSIPYGVDYRQIVDSKRLSAVLSVREDYEISFLILCLGKAKNTLREARRP